MFFVHDDILDLIAAERVNFVSSDPTQPFDSDSQIGPGSVDLRLGLSFRRFKETLNGFDLNTADDTELMTLGAGELLTLEPKEIVLANTLERVFLASDIGAILTGRSSLARIGLQINISQDFIQPGYVNTVPLQLVNLHSDKTISVPTLLSVCQLILLNGSSNTSIPYSINPESKYASTTSETEPSKLGIELGVNQKSDFRPKTQITETGRALIERWNRKLEKEAGEQKQGKGHKNNENEIGKFLINFIALPDVIGISGRSTLREDTIFKEIQAFLSDVNRIAILDVCCGYSTWIEMLEDSVPGTIGQIEFVGIDTSIDCIKKLKASAWRHKFSDFRCELRSADDLDGLRSETGFEIVFFSNSLHEIEPNLYPAIFQNLNEQVNPHHGKIIITDMEELPDSETESLAITWKGEEVERIMTAAGFTPNLTRHKKQVPVFQITASRCKNFDGRAMLRTSKDLLVQKRLSHIELLEHIESDPKETTFYRVQWLKQVAVIAQISKAIKKINEALAQV